MRDRGVLYVNQDLVHMDIATRSLSLVEHHIPLTDEKVRSIRYHDGQYIAETGVLRTGSAV